MPANLENSAVATGLEKDGVILFIVVQHNNLIFIDVAKFSLQ